MTTPSLVPYVALLGLLILLGLQVGRLVRLWRGPLPGAEQQEIVSGKRPMLEGKSPLARLGMGARFGLVFPGVFSLILLASLVSGGRYQMSHNKPEDELVLFIGYLFGSVALGGILALFIPWVRRLPVAVAGCSLALLPMFAGIEASQDNHLRHWTPGATWECVLFSLCLGSFFGLLVRHSVLKVDAARRALGAKAGD